MKFWIAGIATAAFWLSATASAQDAGQRPLGPIEMDQGEDNPFYRQVSEEEVKKLIGIKTRPVRSPITGKPLHIPVEDPSSTDLDSDLCPHPTGKLDFYSPIVLDPDSGFAAYRQHFVKPQSPEIQAWVKKNLTPRLHKVLRDMVGDRMKANPRMIAAHFSQQENLPDIIRCEHALAYYSHINASPAVRARLAWLCAWAYRRAVNDTIEGPYLMNSVLEVVKAMSSDANSRNDDIQDRINRLADLYDATDPDGKPKFLFIERQIIRLMLAGEYDRLGITNWAESCLKAVATASSERKTYQSVQDDPWTQGIRGEPADRIRIAAQQRKAIFEHAQARRAMLAKEAKYLGLAAKLIREGLAADQYPPEKRAFFIYLVGEFERRRENFGAAKMWLGASSSLLTEAGEGDYARKQLQILTDYIGRRGGKVNLNYAGKDQDRTLLMQQVKLVRMAREQGNIEDVRTSVPPAIRGGMPTRLHQRPPCEVNIPPLPEE